MDNLGGSGGIWGVLRISGGFWGAFRGFSEGIWRSLRVSEHSEALFCSSLESVLHCQTPQSPQAPLD